MEQLGAFLLGATRSLAAAFLGAFVGAFVGAADIVVSDFSSHYIVRAEQGLWDIRWDLLLGSLYGGCLGPLVALVGYTIYFRGGFPSYSQIGKTSGVTLGVSLAGAVLGPVAALAAGGVAFLVACHLVIEPAVKADSAD